MDNPFDDPMARTQPSKRLSWLGGHVGNSLAQQVLASLRDCNCGNAIRKPHSRGVNTARGELC